MKYNKCIYLIIYRSSFVKCSEYIYSNKYLIVIATIIFYRMWQNLPCRNLKILTSEKFINPDILWFPFN